MRVNENHINRHSLQENCSWIRMTISQQSAMTRFQEGCILMESNFLCQMSNQVRKIQGMMSNSTNRGHVIFVGQAYHLQKAKIRFNAMLLYKNTGKRNHACFCCPRLFLHYLQKFYLEMLEQRWLK